MDFDFEFVDAPRLESVEHLFSGPEVMLPRNVARAIAHGSHLPPTVRIAFVDLTTKDMFWLRWFERRCRCPGSTYVDTVIGEDGSGTMPMIIALAIAHAVRKVGRTYPSYYNTNPEGGALTIYTGSWRFPKDFAIIAASGEEQVVMVDRVTLHPEREA